jgi:hypothetical protein
MNKPTGFRSCRALAAMSAATLVCGCASIITSESQEMSFQSNPSGAVVTVDEKILGRTPVTIRLDKRKDRSVTFSKEGYKPVTMDLTTKLEPWFMGNIIFGGFLGSTTDSLSGAMHQYSPDKYHVTLEPENVSSLESPTALSKQVRLTAFVVARHQEILLDLDRGHGENMDALATLLEIPSDRKAEEMTHIGTLASSIPDAVSFADLLVHQYLPIAQQPPPPAPAPVKPGQIDAFGRGSLVTPTF